MKFRFVILLFFTLIRPASSQEFKKYDYKENLRAIKKSTPNNCYSHGDVDCSKGTDKDGSVICKDGYRDSVLKYEATCQEVKLEAEYLIATTSETKPFVRHGKKLESELKGLIPKAFVLNLRNLSNVKATNISVEFTIDRKYPFYASGPKDILPYGLAEYNLELSSIEREVNLPTLIKTVYRISCDNCEGILSSR